MSCMDLVSSNFYFHYVYSKEVIRKWAFVLFTELSLTFLNKKVHFNSIWVLISLLLELLRQSKDFQWIWWDAGELAAPWAGGQGSQGLPGQQSPADRAWCLSLGRHRLCHQAPPWGCRFSGTSPGGWGSGSRLWDTGPCTPMTVALRDLKFSGRQREDVVLAWGTPRQSPSDKPSLLIVSTLAFSSQVVREVVREASKTPSCLKHL